MLAGFLVIRAAVVFRFFSFGAGTVLLLNPGRSVRYMEPPNGGLEQSCSLEAKLFRRPNPALGSLCKQESCRVPFSGGDALSAGRHCSC